MDLAQALGYSFGQLRGAIRHTVADLDADALAWRPDAEANSVGWLVWHLTRVQDNHVADIADRDEVWHTGGWAARFGLPAQYDDTGYGHTSQDVAEIRPDDPAVLTAYHDAVAQMTADYLDQVDDADFERVIDRSFDPAVTVGVRLMSVTSDTLQHLGQAGYVRGLLQRRH